MNGNTKIISDEGEVISSGSFIPFTKKDSKSTLIFNYDSFSTSVNLEFKDDKKDDKKYYTANWSDIDNKPILELIFYNTPLPAQPGGPTTPIKLGNYNDKTIYLRIRTFGSSKENIVIFYTLYANDRDLVDD